MKSKEAGKDEFKGGQKNAWIFATKSAHQLADDGQAQCLLLNSDGIKLKLTGWAAVGPKTVAEFTEKNNSLDPPARSNMGPFFFGGGKMHLLRPVGLMKNHRVF